MQHSQKNAYRIKKYFKLLTPPVNNPKHRKSPFFATFIRLFILLKPHNHAVFKSYTQKAVKNLLKAVDKTVNSFLDVI